jgi:putative sterol carrier protein
MATKEEINNIFPEMIDNFRADKASGIDATIQFDLSGDNGGLYWVKISDQEATQGTGEVAEPDMTVRAAADDFYDIAQGDMQPMQAFMRGKIKVDDMNLGMKMISMFGLG